MPREVTTHDERMMGLAAKRYQVQLANGRRAVLLAWRPHNRRHNHTDTARVEYPGGGRATVKTSDVVLILADAHGIAVNAPVPGREESCPCPSPTAQTRRVSEPA